MYHELWNLDRSTRQSFEIGSPVAQWAKLEGVEGDLPRWLSTFDSERRLFARVDKRLNSIRVKMKGTGSAGDEWIYFLDEIVCGDTQPHAVDMLGLGSDSEALKLAQQRSFRGLLQLTELGGDAVGVFGLNADFGSIAAIGVGVALTSRLIDGYLDNANGSTAQNIIREVIAPLQGDRRLKLAVKSVMADQGIESSVIDDPSLLYGLELNPNQLNRVDSVLRPLLTGGAMLASNNWWGLLVGGIGSIAKPLGDFVLRYESQEKVPAQKLAGNAGEKGFLKFMRNKHLQMVMGIRIAAEAPSFFKLATVLLRDRLGAQFAGTFIGAVDGVRGVSGTVTRSREAVASMEKVLAVLKTVEYLKNPKSPILSDVNYGEHIRLESTVIDNVPRELSDRIENGVMVHKLIPYFGSFPDSGISAAFASGDIVKIDANSGQGKTVFLEAMRQSYNHDGLVALKRNGVLTDVHNLSRREVRQRIVSLSKDSLDAKGGRVIDFASELFAMVVRNYDSKPINDPIIRDIAKLVSGLSEGEKEILFNSGYDIAKLNTNNSIIGKYSIKLKQAIKPFLEMKHSWVNQLLLNYIPENEKVTPLSMYDNELSQGQKQRVINALLRGYFEYGEVDVLILDEIMEGLDPSNAQKTIDDLYQLVESADRKPVIMWLAHTRNELPEKKFGLRYKEFDLGSGLYKSEKSTMLTELLKVNNERYLASELEILGNSIANAKLLLNVMNFRNQGWEDKFRLKLVDLLESSFSLEWRDYLENLSRKLGFNVTSNDVLDVIETEWDESIDTDNVYNQFYLRDVSLWSWLNIPLIKWFNSDQIAVLLKTSPGEAIRIQGRISERFDRYYDYFDRKLNYYDWQGRIIRTVAQEVVMDMIGKPADSSKWYLSMLTDVLARLPKDQSTYWFALLDDYVLASLNKRGIDFVAGLEQHFLGDGNEMISLTESDKLVVNGFVAATHDVFMKSKLARLDI